MTAAPAGPDPRGADAWIAYLRWKAEGSVPPGLPLPGRTGSLAEARTAALREGRFTETDPAPGL